MKITTFNPQIISKNPEELVQLFKELGFEERHNQKDIGDLDVNGIRMKDGNGFYVDISTTEHEIPVPKDFMTIRMNVDNFAQAYSILTSHGFKNFYGNHLIETPTSKSAMMINSSGVAINLIEHLKK